MSSSDDDIDYLNSDDYIPEEIVEAAKTVSLKLLPTKSKQKYTAVYNQFKAWRKTKRTTTFAEDIFLVYFDELSESLAPTTLWSRYSMLKTTIYHYDNIDIGKYRSLITLLKRKNLGHTSKKSKVLKAGEILKFLYEAPDEIFLAVKVALVIGVMGACRRAELTNLMMQDIEDHDSMLLIKIPNTKTHIPRSFIVVDEPYQICKKYIDLRPKNTSTDRFFLCYQNGKCVNQPIGINTFGSMPKTIATYLQLPEPKCYTGHCYRRTAATILADAGADFITIKRVGDWKSSSVAEGYIESSLATKTNIGKQINNFIHRRGSFSLDQISSSAETSTSVHNQTNSSTAMPTISLQSPYHLSDQENSTVEEIDNFRNQELNNFIEIQPMDSPIIYKQQISNVKQSGSHILEKSQFQQPKSILKNNNVSSNIKNDFPAKSQSSSNIMDSKNILQDLDQNSNVSIPIINSTVTINIYYSKENKN